MASQKEKDADEEARLYEAVDGPGVPIKRVRGMDETEPDANGVKHGCMFMTCEGGTFDTGVVKGTFAVSMGGTAVIIDIGESTHSTGRRYLLDVKDLIAAALAADKARLGR